MLSNIAVDLIKRHLAEARRPKDGGRFTYCGRNILFDNKHWAVAVDETAAQWLVETMQFQSRRPLFKDMYGGD